MLPVRRVQTRSGLGSSGDSSRAFVSRPRTVSPPSAAPVRPGEAHPARGATPSSPGPQPARPPPQVQQEGGAGEEQRPLLQEGHRPAPQEPAQPGALLGGGF